MKKLGSIVLLFAIIITMCSLSACSSESKLVNDWVCDERPNSDYPTQITLFNDGTGVMNMPGSLFGEFSIEWRVENSRLYTTGPLNWANNYDYSLAGDILYLDGNPYHINNGE